MLPTTAELDQRFAAQYGDVSRHGWRVRMQRRFGYFSPQLVYETLVESLVSGETRWLDVGGGTSLFPDNPALAEALAKRCKLLVGVDPSDNIHVSPYVHERFQCRIEDYVPAEPFTLATLRMVAEHIDRPEAAVSALGRMLTPGGYVVVYTPNKWSIASMAARVIPNAWHPRLTNWLWNTRAEDVFPTVYRMNTRRDLRAGFSAGGFREMAFARLAACSLGARFRVTHVAELLLWRFLCGMKSPYPENNLLAVYQFLGANCSHDRTGNTEAEG